MDAGAVLVVGLGVLEAEDATRHSIVVLVEILCLFLYINIMISKKIRPF